MTAEEQIADAYTAFDAWVREHDPDGAMDIGQQADAYAKWCAHDETAERIIYYEATLFAMAHKAGNDAHMQVAREYLKAAIVRALEAAQMARKSR